ncbi:hypothetical protein EXU57_15570 [Segetibacter sp. 3557_3]|uniref:hypothetical protein n=1 Tax=Segetibacter sp. 3557_3 TaxID=2547429 RepID=UPI0010583BA7|nr:hypothetical protein [Segetibacter sp. 3557_3]TDH24230.1 hypothetical protein EXU57_15570 [Segetibacter sp. 3557_3]
MKKITGLCLVMGILFSSGVIAQQDTTVVQEVKQGAKNAGKAVGKGAKSAGKAVGKGAKKLGNKTAEVASKGFSEVKDKTYKGKTGPDGQTIYIDKHSKYYWVDEKGVKQYVAADQLKDKMD